MATAKKAAESASSKKEMPQLNFDLGKLTAASRVYIVEHFIVHLSLIFISISTIALFNSVIDHLMEDTMAVSPLLSALTFETLAVYIAMALVAMPLFALFYTRTRKAERAHADLMLSRARRRLIYITLSILALVMIGYAIGFLYTSVLAVVQVETMAGSEGWVQSTLKQWFALAFLGLVSYFVSRLTLGVSDGGKALKANKQFATAIAVVTALVVVSAASLPLWEERNNSIDRAIESDFRDISQLVDDYYSENRRLPDTLDDLALIDEIDDRAGRYGYAMEKQTSTMYELCANFKTDTTGDSDDSNSFFQTRTHMAGYDCIEYEVFSYFYDEPVETQPFETFDLNGAENLFDFDSGEFDASNALEALETFDFSELESL